MFDKLFRNLFILISLTSVIALTACEKLNSGYRLKQRNQARKISLLASRAEGTGYFSQAIDLFQQALVLDPENGWIHYHLANSIMGKLSNDFKLNDKDRTDLSDLMLKEYRLAVKYNPQMISAWKGLADVYITLGKFPEAEAAGEKAYKLDNNDPGVFRILGKVKRELKNTEDSFMYLNKAAESEPENYWTHMELASMYLEKKQPEDALIESRKAIYYCPDCPEAYEQLGLVFESQNKKNEANKAYEQAQAVRQEAQMQAERLKQLEEEEKEAENQAATEQEQGLETNPHLDGYFIK